MHDQYLYQSPAIAMSMDTADYHYPLIDIALLIFFAIRCWKIASMAGPSNFTGVGGEWGERRMYDITPDPNTKFLNSPLSLASWG